MKKSLSTPTSEMDTVGHTANIYVMEAIKDLSPLADVALIF